MYHNLSFFNDDTLAFFMHFIFIFRFSFYSFTIVDKELDLNLVLSIPKGKYCTVPYFKTPEAEPCGADTVQKPFKKWPKVMYLRFLYHVCTTYIFFVLFT